MLIHQITVFLLCVWLSSGYEDDNEEDGDLTMSILDSVMDAAGKAIAREGHFFTSLVEEVTVKLDQCEFSCPNKKKPKPRKSFTPSYNGCGSYGYNLDFEKFNMPGFTSCCNTHDICYETCNRNKIECDDEFEMCLLQACETLKPRGSQKKPSMCDDSAKLMYNLVRKLGCPAYGTGQKNACDCS